MNFEEWWEKIGSGITPDLKFDDFETHAKKVSENLYIHLSMQFLSKDDIKIIEKCINITSSCLNNPLFSHIEEVNNAVMNFKNGLQKILIKLEEHKK